jgi:glycosyltransferase involved in cell wall biosynthesis
MDVAAKGKQILYITYDGLTDPLGQSQILPYLKGLSAQGYRFTILSFEKKDRFAREEGLIRELTAAAGIRWVPLTFTSRPPLLSKFYDAVRMQRKAVSLHRATPFDMVHCRSYIAADVGLYLKKRFGIRFFFDMRGFWADEKKDGSWDVSHPVYKRIYTYYKQKEAAYLQGADYIISLTQAGRREMMTWSAFNPAVPLQVIPCCADMQHFTLTSESQRAAARRALGLPEDALVLSYLGSVGTWYMLDEMLQLFKTVLKRYPSARFLFITHSPEDLIRGKAAALGIGQEQLLVREGSRREVPQLVKASNINISFIRPVYSKISSSPTKLGEVLSMGIPVIANSGVGDVAEIIQQTGAGYVLDAFTPEAFERVADAIPLLLKTDPAAVRQKAEAIYSLEKGIALYLECYNQIFNPVSPAVSPA